MGIFTQALASMAASGSPVYGPVSFQAYCREQGIAPRSTAACISVQSIEGLDAELRAASTTVFRLGSPQGTPTTEFALVRSSHGLDRDFFLVDSQIFADVSPRLFIPAVPFAHLYAFHLLPGFTETSLVNLAMSSGLLPEALGLDRGHYPSAPATGQSTYTFSFVASAEVPIPLCHNNGQVEIDAVFTGCQKGQEKLFVVEAKATGKFTSLSKHKLAYAVLAMRNTVPKCLPIVPVYLRCVPDEKILHFHIAECTYDTGTDGMMVLSSLRPKSVRHLAMTRC